jgi:hypothetical protein
VSACTFLFRTYPYLFGLCACSVLSENLVVDFHLSLAHLTLFSEPHVFYPGILVICKCLIICGNEFS